MVVLLGHAVPGCMLGWLYTIRVGYTSPEEAWLYSRALTEHLRANPMDMGLTKMPCFDCHRVRQVLCVYKVVSLQQLGAGWRKVSVPMAWVCVDISHAPEQWSMTCRAFAGRGAGVRSQQLSV